MLVYRECFATFVHTLLQKRRGTSLHLVFPIAYFPSAHLHGHVSPRFLDGQGGSKWHLLRLVWFQDRVVPSILHEMRGIPVFFHVHISFPWLFQARRLLLVPTTKHGCFQSPMQNRRCLLRTPPGLRSPFEPEPLPFWRTSSPINLFPYGKAFHKGFFVPSAMARMPTSASEAQAHVVVPTRFLWRYGGKQVRVTCECLAPSPGSEAAWTCADLPPTPRRGRRRRCTCADRSHDGWKPSR